uniref:Protein kinase domain-containing protein n=1 Tax=Aegilops tauschii subsp. strangulata TaxID=200361 RepID=A0A453T284_AEGTS
MVTISLYFRSLDISMRTQNLRSHLIFCVLNSFLQLTNILLREDMEPKLSDFGLAKTLQMEETKVFTDVGGTIGYMDPEYITHSKLTCASDIYSFGVVVLQLLKFLMLLIWSRFLSQGQRCIAPRPLPGGRARAAAPVTGCAAGLSLSSNAFDSGGLLGELLHLPLCNPPSSRRARNARKEGAPLPCPGEVNTWPSDRSGGRIDKKNACFTLGN